VGGSSGDDGRVLGLTDFGRRIIAEMERLGIVVDLAHVSDPLFWDAIRAARRPVLASHSSSRQLANVPRNLTDAHFDGIPITPVGLEDATKLPDLTAELLRRGMSEADVRKVLGENLLRVLDANAPAR
jgi:membrane dipeptidase